MGKSQRYQKGELNKYKETNQELLPPKNRSIFHVSSNQEVKTNSSTSK